MTAIVPNGPRAFIRLGDASQSPQLGVHQGYTTDGTLHYTFDTAKVQKRANDGSWTVQTENTTPFSGVASVDHLGDGAYYNSSLYVPMTAFTSISSGGSEHIAIFNASTLARTSAVDCTGASTRSQFMAGLCVVEADSLIYSVDFVDGTKIWKWNLSDCSYVGTISLSGKIPFPQGISYYGGMFYVSSNWGAVYAVSPAGTVLGVVAEGLPDQSTTTNHEGIDVTQGDLRWLIDQGVSSRYVHYYSTTNRPSVTLSAYGQETYGSVPPVAGVVLSGSGIGAGVSFGSGDGSAPAIFKSNTGTRILRLIRHLNLLNDGGTSGSGLSMTPIDANGQPAANPVFSVDYDTTVGIRMGPAGGGSARDTSLTRDTLGARWLTSQQVQTGGVATTVQDTSGVTSAQIDALFSLAPPNGMMLLDATNYILWHRLGGTWYPHFIAPPDAVASGAETMPRDAVTSISLAFSTQQLRLSYFTARKSFTSTQAIFECGGNVSGTPTLIRWGLYSVAANGDLSLVASTANDTTLMATSATEYSKAWQSNYDVVAGKRYALGVLQVGATSVTYAGASIVPAAANARAPRLTALVSGQSDLPDPIAAGSLSNGVARVYGIVAP